VQQCPLRAPLVNVTKLKANVGGLALQRAHFLESAAWELSTVSKTVVSGENWRGIGILNPNAGGQTIAARYDRISDRGHFPANGARCFVKLFPIQTAPEARHLRHAQNGRAEEGSRIQVVYVLPAKALCPARDTPSQSRERVPALNIPSRF
jgi:hypothetical protein